MGCVLIFNMSLYELSILILVESKPAPPNLTQIFHGFPRRRGPRKGILNINRGGDNVLRITIQAKTNPLSSNSLYPSHSSHCHLLSFLPYPAFASLSYTTIPAASSSPVGRRLPCSPIMYARAIECNEKCVHNWCRTPQTWGRVESED